jgi:hypothetical protein
MCETGGSEPAQVFVEVAKWRTRHQGHDTRLARPETQSLGAVATGSLGVGLDVVTSAARERRGDWPKWAAIIGIEGITVLSEAVVSVLRRRA